MKDTSTHGGYTHSCRKTTGGIKSIKIFERCELEDIVFNSATGTYGGIKLKEGYRPKTYIFKEGAAKFQESMHVENGCESVDHEIEFYLDMVDGGTTRCVEELTLASQCGIIAVVTTANDVSFLAGYSEELYDERPLKLREAEATSGYVHKDACGIKIKLGSRDISMSRIFTGVIK